MAIKSLLCCISLCSFLYSHIVQGNTELSNSNELEWEKQYQLLKKPSIKTIKTDNGDIYDCVDFYKQLAFDHPLLKNHTFHPQMRPSTIPERKKTMSTPENGMLKSIELKSIGCPKGTVPIRRVSKHEFFKTMEFTKRYTSRINYNSIQPQPGTNFAIIQSKFNTSKIYNGLGAELSIYNLTVGSSQYTSGETIVQHGNDRIQIGWTVNPSLNHDNEIRLFQYFNAGQSHCFNMMCPGFVSVNPDIPIDVVITPPSEIGKDPKDGNWWFVIGKEKTPVGFWPQRIFTDLTKAASYVAVGGETYTPSGQPLPPMGSGYYPKGDLNVKVIAHCSNLFVVDENRRIVDFQDTEKFVTNNAYDAVDKGPGYYRYGHIMFYGGGL